MYKPKFNQVLVEIIPDVSSKWGGRPEENLGGEVFREGKYIDGGIFVATQEYPIEVPEDVCGELDKLKGKTIMWNEGHEAGKVFEHDGKQYALINWFDIIGEKVES